MRDSLKHFAQGLLMGGADVIPGVSGGTMALIVGIYRRLIDSLSSLFSVVLSLLRGDFAAVRRHLWEVEWGLIVPLGIGIACALLIGARIIPPLLSAYPVQCRGLFFGLIAGSLAIPWIRIGHINGRLFLIALAGAVAAFVLVGLPPREILSPGLLRVFASAAMAICAMILPGVSGAFLLYVLGIYGATLEALNSRDLVYVLVFMAGAATGLGLFSKVLNWLLKNYHDRTMAALVGLMAGSLRALWPWQEEDRSLFLPEASTAVLYVILLGLLGFAFVSALTWWGARPLEEETHPSRSQ